MMTMSCVVYAYDMPADSVGLEKKGGKTYILHKVEEKETLYSLSRRYNVSINQIIDSNQSSDFRLTIGDVIRVPYFAKVDSKPIDKKEPVLQDGEQIHVVKSKETMFSISKTYSVSIDDIRKWNGLDGNALSIGQKLIIKSDSGTTSETISEPSSKPIRGGKRHIVGTGETLFSISRKYDVTVDDIRKWNELIGNDISIGQELFVTKPGPMLSPIDRNMEINEPVSKEAIGADIGEEPENIKIEEDENAATPKVSKDIPVTTAPEKSNSTFVEVSEAGMAELIPGSEDSRK